VTDKEATQAYVFAALDVMNAFKRSWRSGWRPGLTKDEKRTLEHLAYVHRESVGQVLRAVESKS